jgi:hypothetical protein
MHLAHTRTLGPRGAVGVNPCAVHKGLEALEILVHAVDNGSTRTARFHRRGDGEAVISFPLRLMGGRLQANARRRQVSRG